MDEIITCKYCGKVFEQRSTVHIHDHDGVADYYHSACWREKLVDVVKEAQDEMFEYYNRGYP